MRRHMVLNNKFPNEKHPVESNFEWKSKDGRKTKIRDMDTRHIVNTIKIIERGAHATRRKGGNAYKAMIAELKWRQQMAAGKNAVIGGGHGVMPKLASDVDQSPAELSAGGIFFEYKHKDNERDHE